MVEEDIECSSKQAKQCGVSVLVGEAKSFWSHRKINSR